MSLTTPLRLKSERIQSPGNWEISADQTTASVRYQFGSRSGAVAFIGLASEMAEREGFKVGFLFTEGTAVRVTLEAGSERISERDYSLFAAFNRLVGEDEAA